MFNRVILYMGLFVAVNAHGMLTEKRFDCHRGDEDQERRSELVKTIKERLATGRGLDEPVSRYDDSPPLLILPYIRSNNGYMDLCEQLLRKGACTEVVNYMGRTPLSIACLCNNYRMVAPLLRHRAKVNAQDLRGRTPIWHCFEVLGGVSLESLRLLLANESVDLSVRDDRGDTVLHEAVLYYFADHELCSRPGVRRRIRKGISLLLERGCDRTLTGREGTNAIQYARSLGENKIADYIEKFGQSVELTPYQIYSSKFDDPVAQPKAYYEWLINNDYDVSDWKHFVDEYLKPAQQKLSLHSSGFSEDFRAEIRYWDDGYPYYSYRWRVENPDESWKGLGLPGWGR